METGHLGGGAGLGDIHDHEIAVLVLLDSETHAHHLCRPHRCPPHREPTAVNHPHAHQGRVHDVVSSGGRARGTGEGGAADRNEQRGQGATRQIRCCASSRRAARGAPAGDALDFEEKERLDKEDVTEDRVPESAAVAPPAHTPLVTSRPSTYAHNAPAPCRHPSPPFPWPTHFCHSDSRHCKHRAAPIIHHGRARAPAAVAC